MEKNKIMLVEDDVMLRTQVKEIFTSFGYEVIAPDDFNIVEKTFLDNQPKVVILDINLPVYDGNYFCRLFRKHANIPIIMTSARNSDSDQLLSMELGADEYITKPFNVQILLAKVNALVRRTYGEYSAIGSTEINGLVLNEAAFTANYQNKIVELSKNEFKLLKTLITNYDSYTQRADLLEELWDSSDFVDDNTLTVNITRLKGRLALLGLNEAIKTKRGVGYKLEI